MGDAIQEWKKGRTPRGNSRELLSWSLRRRLLPPALQDKRLNTHILIDDSKPHRQERIGVDKGKEMHTY